MSESQLQDIRTLVEPILSEEETELVELTCRPQSGQLYIRLLVDKIGGITIQECARLNQRVTDALDAARLVEGAHTVEVSSPGLDRPLASLRDYERAIGEEVNVETRLEDGRTKTVRGMLLAVQADAIVVKAASGNVTVPLDHVHLAKKAVRW